MDKSWKTLVCSQSCASEFIMSLTLTCCLTLQIFFAPPSQKCCEIFPTFWLLMEDSSVVPPALYPQYHCRILQVRLPIDNRRRWSLEPSIETPPFMSYWCECCVHNLCFTAWPQCITIHLLWWRLRSIVSLGRGRDFRCAYCRMGSQIFTWTLKNPFHMEKCVDLQYWPTPWHWILDLRLLYQC